MPKLTPEESVTHYRYDAFGNLVKKYVRRGKARPPASDGQAPTPARKTRYTF